MTDVYANQGWTPDDPPAGDEGACAGVEPCPHEAVELDRAGYPVRCADCDEVPPAPAISGEQSTGGVRDKVFQAIISGDDAWDITDRVLAALSAPVDKGPTCQVCGGEIEGWTCQSCARLFRENPSGALVMDPVDKGEAVADPAEFELIQDDMQVASVCAPRDRAIAEILHYAAVYGQDGPVEILEIVRTPWTLAALQGGSNA